MAVRVFRTDVDIFGELELRNVANKPDAASRFMVLDQADLVVKYRTAQQVRDDLQIQKIQAGSVTGQMLYWDNSSEEWKPTASDKLFWDVTNKRLGIGTDSPSTILDIEVYNAGQKTTYGTVRIADVDAQLDIVSTGGGTWGSAINFVEGAGSSNTDVWSIARQTTDETGDSSLNFNFGSNNQHNNPTKVKFTTDGKVLINTTTDSGYHLQINGAVNTESFYRVHSATYSEATYFMLTAINTYHNQFNFSVSSEHIAYFDATGFTINKRLVLDENLYYDGDGIHYIKHNGDPIISNGIKFRFNDDVDVLSIYGNSKISLTTGTEVNKFAADGDADWSSDDELPTSKAVATKIADSVLQENIWDYNNDNVYLNSVHTGKDLSLGNSIIRTSRDWYNLIDFDYSTSSRTYGYVIMTNIPMEDGMSSRGMFVVNIRGYYYTGCSVLDLDIAFYVNGNDVNNIKFSSYGASIRSGDIDIFGIKLGVISGKVAIFLDTTDSYFNFNINVRQSFALQDEDIYRGWTVIDEDFDANATKVVDVGIVNSFKEIRLNNGNTRIDQYSATNGGISIHTPHGYTTIGNLNSGYSHFLTNASNGFYFDKKVYFNGNVLPYQSYTYDLGDTSHYWKDLYINRVLINDGSFDRVALGKSSSYTSDVVIYSQVASGGWGIKNGQSTDLLMHLSYDGNLGIGVKDVNKTLVIGGAKDPTLVLGGSGNNDTNSGTIIFAESTQNTDFGTNVYGVRITYDGNTNYMYVQTANGGTEYNDAVSILRSTGTVGIGRDTVNSSYKLHVAGDSLFDNSITTGDLSGSYIKINNNTLYFNRESANYFNAATDGYFVFNPGGNTGNTTSSSLIIHKNWVKVQNSDAANLYIHGNSGGAYVQIDSGRDGNGTKVSGIIFRDNDTSKYLLRKNTDNNFDLYSYTNAKSIYWYEESTDISSFRTRVKGEDAVDADDFVTLGQITTGTSGLWTRYNSYTIKPSTTGDRILLENSDGTHNSSIFNNANSGTYFTSDVGQYYFIASNVKNKVYIYDTQLSNTYLLLYPNRIATNNYSQGFNITATDGSYIKSNLSIGTDSNPHNRKLNVRGVFSVDYDDSYEVIYITPTITGTDIMVRNGSSSQTFRHDNRDSSNSVSPRTWIRGNVKIHNSAQDVTKHSQLQISWSDGDHGGYIHTRSNLALHMTTGAYEYYDSTNSVWKYKATNNDNGTDISGAQIKLSGYGNLNSSKRVIFNEFVDTPDGDDTSVVELGSWRRGGLVVNERLSVHNAGALNESYYLYVYGISRIENIKFESDEIRNDNSSLLLQYGNDGNIQVGKSGDSSAFSSYKSMNNFYGYVLVNGASNNNGNANFAVKTDGESVIALSGDEARIGSVYTNWSVRIRSSGHFITWGQDAKIGVYGGQSTAGTKYGTSIHYYNYDQGGVKKGVYVNGNGKVGIRCDNPSADLEIGNDGVAEQKFRINSDEAGRKFEILTAGNMTYLRAYDNQNLQISSTGAGGYVTFATNGIERARINYNGRVGIGTTTPTQALHVNGKINVNTSGDDLVISSRHGDNSTGYNTWIGGGGNDSIGDATYNYYGSYNTSVGYGAMYATTTGFMNVGIGTYSLYHMTTGYHNIAIGYKALHYISTGRDNTALGYKALYGITTGYQNIGIGHSAGYFLPDGGTLNQTSNGSIYIGYDTSPYADGDTNEIVIGYGTNGKGSNTITFGNDDIEDTYLKGRIHLNNIPNKSNATYLLVEDSGVVKRASVDDVIDNETPPDMPDNLSAVESGDHTVLTWNIDTSVDYYEVWLSETSNSAGFSLVGKVVQEMIPSGNTTVSFSDFTYERKTTLYYKVYAYRNGKISSPATTSVTVVNEVSDVSDLQVVKLAHALFISWTTPDDRRLDKVQIKIDFASDQANLSEANATVIYEGKRGSVNYQIPDANKDDYYEVWATSVTKT